MDRTIIRTFACAAAAAALVASGAALVAGQAPAPAVFTAQQARDGKAAYARSCASCHMPDLSGSNEIPALKGPTFTATWGARTTKDFFDYVSTAMPYSAPSLTTGEYTAITAYILESNGASAGTIPLTAATDVAIDGLVSATD
jgi:mono/diheme cytochrome c family protein